ncbi:MAG: DNA polymerase III subunit beta [Calditrichaeota bacterium]|nr:DNA polymerase III subunit beta [Calditrichota bacterium]
MKFSIDRNALFDVLQKVINVVPQRSTISITQTILIQATNAGVDLVATDLEITMAAHVNAQIEEPGSAAVVGRMLYEIIRELPESTLHFEVEPENRLILRTDFGNYKIAGDNPANFPKRPEFEKQFEISLKNDVLRRLIEKTVFACSTDELRPALTGVYFEFEEGYIRTVATDGHRLSMMKYNEPNIQEALGNVIISTRALNLLLRNLNPESTTIMEIGQNHVVFRLDSTLIFARLIDEAYVDYHRVIPPEIHYEMIADTDQLMASIKRVSLFANPITLQIIMRIYRDYMEIFAQDIDYGGEAQERIPCEFTGDEFVVGFNSRYLQEVLRHVDSSQVRMQFVRPDYAVLVRPVDPPENEEQLMLLMPVRLDQV